MPGAVADETFRRANCFSAVGAEVEAASRRVAIADLSVFSKFEVTGPDTETFLEVLGANRAPRPGRIGLTHALTPTGGVLSEFTVARLRPHHAYLTSAAGAEEIDLDLLNTQAGGLDVRVVNVTDQIAVIGFMGPRAPEVLPELADMPWLSVKETTVCGVEVRAMRVSYIGEAGWELHVDAAKAAGLFEALERSALPQGLGFYGGYAANSMRLEKGYRAWGADLTTERSPLEAGLGSFVRSDFRDALDRESPWDMVLLEIEPGDVDPFYAHTLWQADRPIGIVTSGAYGHHTGKVLALAYLRDPAARVDLTVSILGHRHTATILADPPYDPTNTRLKSGASS
ncbi:MAG: aminomethyltransferase family protein [Pseudomonadota bacterium]